jgi:hypothetical protein
MILLPSVIGLVSIATVFLYLRARTKPTLAMLVAVLLGWMSVALGMVAPSETVTPAADTGGQTLESPQRGFVAVTVRSKWEAPLFWLSMGSTSLWCIGFVAHSFTASRKH